MHLLCTSVPVSTCTVQIDLNNFGILTCRSPQDDTRTFEYIPSDTRSSPPYQGDIPELAERKRKKTYRFSHTSPVGAPLLPACQRRYPLLIIWLKEPERGSRAPFWHNDWLQSRGSHLRNPTVATASPQWFNIACERCCKDAGEGSRWAFQVTA